MCVWWGWLKNKQTNNSCLQGKGSESRSCLGNLLLHKRQKKRKLITVRGYWFPQYLPNSTSPKQQDVTHEQVEGCKPQQGVIGSWPEKTLPALWFHYIHPFAHTTKSRLRNSVGHARDKGQDLVLCFPSCPVPPQRTFLVHTWAPVSACLIASVLLGAVLVPFPHEFCSDALSSLYFMSDTLQDSQHPPWRPL